MFDIRFNWDENKNRTNERKHGLNFRQAARVFYDPFHVAQKERVVDDEIRWQTIGMADGELLLLVVHTVRQEGDVELVRIISARRAQKHERRVYETKNR